MMARHQFAASASRRPAYHAARFMRSRAISSAARRDTMPAMLLAHGLPPEPATIFYAGRQPLRRAKPGEACHRDDAMPILRRALRP